MNDNCPKCNVTLIGDPIPEKDREFFGNSTHFRREIGMEYPEFYDGTVEWRCPDCKHLWNAFSGKLGEGFARKLAIYKKNEGIEE